MTTKTCIYHANCPDGFASAISVYTSPKWGSDTNFITAHYGNPPPDVTGHDVIEEAWEIMQRQHTDSPYIFPYNPRTISAIFTRTCKVLGIEDLHFQDFRHWGVSEKFIVKGLHIHEVAEYSLHESWETLKRYTHFSPKQRALVQAVHELIHSLPN